MKLRVLLFGLLLLALPLVASAQVKELCDSSLTCSMYGDAVVGDDLTVMGDVVAQSSHGEVFTTKYVTAELALDGATSTSTGLIPAGSIILGCTARVTTAVTGATTWDLGDGSTADLYCNDKALTLGTKCNLADAKSTFNVKYVASAGNLVATANGSNFTAGKLRLTCLVLTGTGPTS